MPSQEFSVMVSRSDFLMDWQKDRLMAMLDNGEMGDGDGCIRPVRREDVFPVIDNVLWRTVGVRLDSLPPVDRVSIEQAVREVAY